MVEKWKLTQYVVDSSREPVYGVSVCDLEGFQDLVATASGAQISLYRLDAETGALQLLRCWTTAPVDEDKLYVCKWMLLSNGMLVVLAAGQRGPIHVLLTEQFTRTALLSGHLACVNDLEVHPTLDDLMLSASKDESIRLWNVRTQLPLAVFTGATAHTGEVLSLHHHALNPYVFASSGIDENVKIWTYRRAAVGIATAGAAHDVCSQIAAPAFSTNSLHTAYIDCVRWHGDVLISKSANSSLFMWRPRASLESLEAHAGGAPAHAFVVLREFAVRSCNVWYIQFDVSPEAELLACGNREGTVRVWSLGDGRDSRPVDVTMSPKEIVRAVHFVPQGSHIVAGLEDGRVCVLARSPASGSDAPSTADLSGAPSGGSGGEGVLMEVD